MRLCRLPRCAVALEIAVMAAGTTASARPVTAQDAGFSIAGYVREAAQRFAIPEAWIHAVIRIESAGDPHAVSPKGATGLMQLMPATWEAMRIRCRLGDDIYDPHDNIVAGAAYLREMYDRYGAPGFLAAYNAGPGRYEDYLANRRALPAETVAYVRKLAPIMGTETAADTPGLVPDPFVWRRSAVFVIRSRRSADASEVAAGIAKPVPLPTAESRSSPPAGRKADSLFIPLSGKTP